MARRYLYVVDDEGREVPGSRRSLDECRSMADVAAIEDALRRVTGAECDIRDNVKDWPAFRRALERR